MSIITGKTSLVGLLGNPVEHSLSPLIHNAALDEMGLDWSYIAMRCEQKNLGLVINGLKEIDCKGLNITIPHKQIAMPMCKDINELARQVGAVNTLVPKEEGGWRGFNTDVQGFLIPLKKRNWKNKKGLILGCGGSARAVIVGLIRLELSNITIAARDSLSLNNFIGDFNNQQISKEYKLTGLINNESLLIEEIENADIIVNTTPVGMKTQSKSHSMELNMPFGEQVWSHLKSHTVLYDLIYTPQPTLWLKNGRLKGCETFDGLEMLIQQGAESLRLWCKEDFIPIDHMRKAAEVHLLK